MPRIPRYEPSVPTPWAPEAATISPAVAGIEGEAMTQAGAAAIGMGKELKTFYETLKASKNAADFAEAKLRMREDMFTTIGELENHPNYEEVPKLWKEKHQQIYQKMMQQSTDPDVQTHLKRVWSNTFPEMDLKVTRFVRQRQIGQMAANTDEQYNRYIDLMVKETSPEQAAKLRGDLVSSIRTMATLGVINPHKAQVMEKEMDEKVAQQRVAKLVTDNPGEALNILTRGNVPGLSETDRLNWIGRATAHQHRKWGEMRLPLDQAYEKGGLQDQKIYQMRDSGQISPQMADYYLRLNEARKANPADIEDKQTALALHDKVLQMEPGDSKTFNKLRTELFNQQLPIKGETRIRLLNKIYKKMEVGEQPTDTFERNQFKQMKDIFSGYPTGDLYYPTFLSQYQEERKKNPNWNQDQIREAINRISQPYLEKIAGEGVKQGLKRLYTPPQPQQPQQPGEKPAPPAKQGSPYWLGNHIFRDDSWR